MHKICTWMNISLSCHSAFFQALDWRDYVDSQKEHFSSVSPYLWYAYVFEPMLSSGHGAAIQRVFWKTFTPDSSAVRLVSSLGVWGCE